MRRLIITMTVVSSLLLLSVGAASASASEGWWHLGSGARPTYLHPDLARDEVQELKVDATGGDVLWDVSYPSEFAVFPYNATHVQVQSALEGIYGKENVEVTGGCSEAMPPLSECAYVVTFKGALGGVSVPPPLDEFGQAGLAGGSNLKGEASVVQATEGRADGELVATAENVGNATAEGEGCKQVGEGQGKYTDSACSEETVSPGTGDYEKTPIRILDKLPPGLRATQVKGTAGALVPFAAVPCHVVNPSLVACEDTGSMPPFFVLEMRIGVVVTGDAPAGAVDESEVNEVMAEGGQTAPVSIRRPVKLSAETEPYGIESYELDAEEEGGTPDTRAGSHPFQLDERPEPLPGARYLADHRTGTSGAFHRDDQRPGLEVARRPDRQSGGGAELSDRAVPADRKS